MAGTIAAHPLDTIRIRLQLQSPENIKYRGIADCAFKTIRLEGFTGLYKGILPLALAESPVLALAFSGKEFGSRILKNNSNYSENSKSLLAGCLGGAISTIVSCPAELLKIKSQSNTKFRTNYSSLMKKMVRTQGVMSLYKGYLLTLIRDVPAFAVYFGIFEIG